MKRLAIIGLLVAACSSPVASAKPAATPAFDIGAVRANFTDECQDPGVVDELFCQQVTIAGMSADGDILNVPTTLNAAAKDRGEVICKQFVFAHFDANAKDLGYRFVGILDKDGGHLAACAV